MHHHLRYRAHIDGLRAVAVLGIVLFHSGAIWLPGGFTGVDVFFVISGFLISKSIFRDVADGRFSMLAFYERRIRRIVPAFLVVALVTSVFAFFILLPNQLVDYAQSLIWSAFALSNVYFYLHSDYFAPAAEELPLLHYWSLGVEEQFYIVFPALLLLCHRLHRATLPWVVGILLVASLTACELILQTNPPAAFYLLPFRAFELLLGAALALPGVPFPNSRTLAGAAVSMGIALVFAGMVLLTSDSEFPGLLALVPCLGAVLIIWGGEQGDNLPAQLLGMRLLVFYGVISYSLYLVHWPIVVFTRMLIPDIEPLPFLLGSVAAATLLGWLSYRFVEQPVRFNRSLFPRPVLASGMVATVALLVTFGVLARNAQEFPGHTSEVQRMLGYMNYHSKKAVFRTGLCFLKPNQTAADLDQATCLPTGKPSVVIWGSSRIAQFFHGLAPALQARGYTLGQITGAACTAVVGLDRARWPNCKPLNDFALEWLLANKPSIVIVGGDPVQEAELAKLDASVRKLASAGIEVVVLGPVPQYKEPVPSILAARMIEGSRDITAGAELTEWYADKDRLIADHFRQSTFALYVSFLKDMCPREGCLLAVNGRPLHFDHFHFTKEGSDYYGSKLAEIIIDKARASDAQSSCRECGSRIEAHTSGPGERGAEGSK